MRLSLLICGQEVIGGERASEEAAKLHADSTEDVLFDPRSIQLLLVKVCVRQDLLQDLRDQ